jgi:signal peptidase II
MGGGTAAGWILPLSLTGVLVADQAVKGWVLTGPRGAQPIALGSFLRIRPSRSERTLAGRLGIRPAILLFAWMACLSTLLLVAPHARLFEASLSQAALGAALGGGAGNVLDVLARRGIVDYVELRGWPPFNLADVAIVLGVIVALLAS